MQEFENGKHKIHMDRDLLKEQTKNERMKRERRKRGGMKREREGKRRIAPQRGEEKETKRKRKKDREQHGRYLSIPLCFATDSRFQTLQDH